MKRYRNVSLSTDIKREIETDSEDGEFADAESVEEIMDEEAEVTEEAVEENAETVTEE